MTWRQIPIAPHVLERIAEGNSCGAISHGGNVRKPFAYEGRRWTCTGSLHHGGTIYAECYELAQLARAAADRPPLPYHEHSARPDHMTHPGGPYHGMRVTCAGEPFVLLGPPVQFVPGAAEPHRQANLFEESPS